MAKTATDYVESLIEAVASAKNHSDLCDAYMAARRPCLDCGEMDALLAADDSASDRLGPAPIAPLIIFG